MVITGHSCIGGVNESTGRIDSQRQKGYTKNGIWQQKLDPD